MSRGRPRYPAELGDAPAMRLSLAIVVLMLLAACVGATPERSTHSADPSTASPSASASRGTAPLATPLDQLSGSEAVAFTTEDGVAIEGRVFGTGDVGVVLAHGSFATGQGSWFPFARTLSDEGYRVLTINLRGFCPGGINGCSAGSRNPPETWRDVVAGAEYLRIHGVERVFLMGASLGARSCLWAASRPGVTVAGVIGISTPLKAVAPYSPGYDFTAEIIKVIDEPKLFVAGDQDEDYAAQAGTLLGWSREPRQITIVSSPAHGPDLMKVPSATEAVYAFLDRYRTQD